MDDSTGSGVALWATPGFHAEASAWVAGVAADRGIELTGEVAQPHNRPWSSAFRFGTTGGALWFKVNGPGTRNEPPLLAVLARLEPGLVAEILAVDADRGWSLARDAGPMMRATAEPDRLWSAWMGLLPRYADAQLRLADHATELLGTGTAELTPQTLPGHAAGLLKTLAALVPEDGGLTTQEADAVAARLPEYERWCAELEESRIPSTLQHDDLHSGNVRWPGSVPSARVIDWGDASVGHPLGTMLCTLNSVAYHAGVDLDDRRVTRVRDAYLEPFTNFAGRSDLVRLVASARRVGCVTRALSYARALQGEPVGTHAGLDFPVRGWFLELLEG